MVMISNPFKMAPTFSNYFICFEGWVSNVRWIEGPFENSQKLDVATPQIHNAICIGPLLIDQPTFLGFSCSSCQSSNNMLLHVQS
jgi:hypothetical protein